MTTISRRHFVQAAGLAAFGLLTACGRLPEQAPSPVVHRIGYLDHGAPMTGAEPPREALGDLGYREGQNLAVEYRLADGHLDHLASFATELAALHLELIVAAGPFPPRIVARLRRNSYCAGAWWR